MIAASPARAAWIVMDRGGVETICADKAEWLTEWRHRVRSIEEADRPAHLRRQSLERMLEANAGIFLLLAREGRFNDALMVTAMVAAADGRLSRLSEMREIPA